MEISQNFVAFSEYMNFKCILGTEMFALSAYVKYVPMFKRAGRRVGGGGAQCVELKLRWQFCVHTITCPEIYF